MNDPDYDEDLTQANEAIAEHNIRLIHQWNHND